MEPITIGVGIVILASVGVAAAIKHYRNKIAVKNGELRKLILSLQQYAQSYEFEECDKPVIDAVKQYLRTLFAKGKLADSMADMDLDRRKEYFTKIVRDIADRMGVQLDVVKIIDLGYYVGGQAYVEQGRYMIDLNEMLLIADPDRLLMTVTHELRHLQQIQALKNDKWGYSSQRKALWMVSLTNYVDWDNHKSKAEYIAYVLQSAENDANKFAEEVHNI